MLWRGPQSLLEEVSSGDGFFERQHPRTLQGLKESHKMDPIESSESIYIRAIKSFTFRSHISEIFCSHHVEKILNDSPENAQNSRT